MRGAEEGDERHDRRARTRLAAAGPLPAPLTRLLDRREATPPAGAGAPSVTGASHDCCRGNRRGVQLMEPIGSGTSYVDARPAECR
jgi:hypothetical protein